MAKPHVGGTAMTDTRALWVLNGRGGPWNVEQMCRAVCGISDADRRAMHNLPIGGEMTLQHEVNHGMPLRVRREA